MFLLLMTRLNLLTLAIEAKDLIQSEGIILNGSAAVSETISKSWAVTWDLALKGTLWNVCCSMGILAALACLGFYIVEFINKFFESGGADWVLTKLLFPPLVVILLSNSGGLISSSALSTRDIMNTYNNQLLASVAAGISFDRTLGMVADHSSLQANIEKLRGQCNWIVDPAELKVCLDDGQRTATFLIDRYKREHGNDVNVQAWIDDLSTATSAAFADPLAALGSATNVTFNSIRSVTTFVPNLVSVGIIEVFLLACQSAFQHMIEVSLLLTALMGPIAVGLSLMPMGAKPIYAWITAFLSLGLCKMSFNIISGLTAVAIANNGPTDQMVIGIFLGILAPVLALGMSTGGGMAIFNGICSAAGSAVGAVGRLV